MSVEATTKTMRTYLDALPARGDFADYFSEEVTWTTVGAGQELQGRRSTQDRWATVSWLGQAQP